MEPLHPWTKKLSFLPCFFFTRKIIHTIPVQDLHVWFQMFIVLLSLSMMMMTLDEAKNVYKFKQKRTK